MSVFHWLRHIIFDPISIWEQLGVELCLVPVILLAMIVIAIIQEHRGNR